MEDDADAKHPVADVSSPEFSTLPHARLNVPLTALKSGEIRILVLDPGKHGEPLSGRLKTIDIRCHTTAHMQPRADADETTYEAISYTWGAPNFCRQLLLHGHGRLMITANLWDALNRFRDVSHHRRLWADAICIDQSNVEERNTQVAQMALVYNAASTVLVWLGRSVPSDALAFATTELYSRHHSPADTLRRLKSCSCCGEAVHIGEEPVLESYLAFGRLLQLPWFSRLWVLQETCYPKEHVIVYRGAHFCSLARLLSPGTLPSALLDLTATGSTRELWSQTVHIWRHLNPLPRTVYMLKRDWDAHMGDSMEKLELIVELRSRSCADPRDRVYALREIMGLTRSSDFMPDYGLSVRQVYEPLMLHLLANTNQQNFNPGDMRLLPFAALALVGTEGDRDTNWPSWLINFNALTPNSVHKLKLYDSWTFLPQFTPAATLLKWRQDNRGTLELRAKPFAIVTEVVADTCVPDYLDIEEHTISRQFERWYQTCSRKVHATYPSTSVNDMCDFLSCGRSGIEIGRELEYLRAWTRGRGPSGDTTDRTKVLARIAVGTTMTTDDIAWVPRETRAGDYMCLVAGAPFPYVIRRVQPIKSTWALIGDGLMFKCMLSEALGGPRQIGCSLQDEPNGKYWSNWRPESRAKNASASEMQRRIDEMGWITLV